MKNTLMEQKAQLESLKKSLDEAMTNSKLLKTQLDLVESEFEQYKKSIEHKYKVAKNQRNFAYVLTTVFGLGAILKH